MNERIKELAEQAKEETDALWAKLTPQEFKDTYNQKFAELIVKECAKIAEQHIDERWDLDFGAGVMLKQHFGIE
jgi:non-homologous end joining protein Ku